MLPGGHARTHVGAIGFTGDFMAGECFVGTGLGLFRRRFAVQGSLWTRLDGFQSINCRSPFLVCSFSSLVQYLGSIGSSDTTMAESISVPIDGSLLCEFSFGQSRFLP